MTSELLSRAEDAVRRALALGATAADAVMIASDSTDVSVRDGKVEGLERSQSLDLGLRAFIGQSSAVVAGSILDETGLAKLAERALAMAKAAPPNPHAGLAAIGEFACGWPDLDLASADQLSSAQLTEMAKAAEQAGLSVAGVSKSSGAGASTSARSVALVTSAGFSGHYRRSGHTISASMIAGEGTGMERDYDYHSAVHLEDLDPPDEIGRTAGERAAKRLKPRKLASQKVPVIFDRRVGTSLVSHLVSAILGSSIARSTSFLKDKLGEQLFADGITIRDDPHRRRGLASRPFDGEGLASAPRDIIAGGRLLTWLTDLQSARQLGLKSTGHASRSTSSSPSPSSSNVHLLPGTLSPQELVRDLHQGFYVTELIGSGANMVTGDYSRGASGFWIEGGEIAFAVSEVTLAGHLLDMFRSLTPANDLRFRAGINAPSCRVEGLTLAGV